MPWESRLVVLLVNIFFPTPPTTPGPKADAEIIQLRERLREAEAAKQKAEEDLAAVKAKEEAAVVAKAREEEPANAKEEAAAKTRAEIAAREEAAAIVRANEEATARAKEVAREARAAAELAIRPKRIRAAREKREKEGRAEAITSGKKGDWLDDYKTNVMTPFVEGGHADNEDEAKAAVVAMMRLKDGYAVLSKLADLERNGLLEPASIRKILDDVPTFANAGKRSNKDCAEVFVAKYGDYIVDGAVGNYTARWILAEAKTRLGEGDIDGDSSDSRPPLSAKPKLELADDSGDGPKPDGQSVQPAKPIRREEPLQSEPVQVVVVDPAAEAGSHTIKRLPVPEELPQQAAKEKVHEVFQQEISAAKTIETHAALAKKLLEQAGGSKDDSAAYYVLLTMAGQQAVAAGEVSLAMDVVDKIHEHYQIDAGSKKAEVLTAMVKSSSVETAAAVFEAAMKLCDEAMERDDFALAERFDKTAAAAGRKTRDPDQNRLAQARQKEIEQKKTRFAVVQKALDTLASEAGDGEANLVVGQWYCFTKGDWPKGLPMLAKASREDLAGLATQDLAATRARVPGDAKRQIALADAWWSLGEKEPPAYKSAFLARARNWYESAMDKTTGLEKARIQERLEEEKALSSSTAPGVAERNAKREANLAAPFKPADKDGYRVWTNLVGDTIVARIDSFVSRRITISQSGKKSFLDGKDESQLNGLEKASLAARLRVLKDTGRSPALRDSAQMDPHVVFLCKDQTTVEWPIIALRGSTDRTVGKVDDFTTVTTVLAETLKANGEFAPLGFALGRRSYPAVSGADNAAPQVPPALTKPKDAESDGEAKVSKRACAEAFVAKYGNYFITGDAGIYTTGWFLKEAKTRLRKGDERSGRAKREQEGRLQARRSGVRGDWSAAEAMNSLAAYKSGKLHVTEDAFLAGSAKEIDKLTVGYFTICKLAELEPKGLLEADEIRKVLEE
jgi:hypothetical protein